MNQLSNSPRALWRAMAVAMLVLAGVAAAAMLIIERAEQPVREYATLAEARRDGAFDRGWLPPFLPPSARALREVHDLDTNERWLSFRADSLELAETVRALAPLAPHEARRTSARRPRHAGADWPAELDAGRRAADRDERHLGLYRSPGEAYCLAVEWRTGRAWGWSCDAPR